MGMDVYSEHGVIAQIDDMTRMLRKSDVKKALAGIKEWFETVDKESLWNMGDKPFDEVFADLKKLTEDDAPALNDLISALDNCCVVNGEPSKYGSDDCYVHHPQALEQIWNRIIETTRPGLPSIREVKVFDSVRTNGGNVPHGVACFIFDSDDCHERRLTETGKLLKKAIGHCDPAEWTIVSY